MKFILTFALLYGALSFFQSQGLGTGFMFLASLAAFMILDEA